MHSTVTDIAHLVQGIVCGDNSLIISSLASIDNITENSLVFADSEDNFKRAQTSKAAAILVNFNVSDSQKTLIQVDHPFKAFIKLLNHFYPNHKENPGIHPSAVIAPDVQIGDCVFVGPYVVIESGSVIGDNTILKSHIHIGRNVSIGANTTIHSHVTIYDNSEIGSKVIIHASTVIGSDGFGYVFVDGQHLKVPHIGKVIIEDQVEIGANTAIDRATMEATIIGHGTKIDNLVQVAHSVKLGKNNILCGFTGIAGSTTSGDGVIFAANVGVSDHVSIEDNVILGARTGVPPRKHLKEGTVYLGNPARPKDVTIKHELSVNRIPSMQKNIKLLMSQISELKKHLLIQEEQ